MTDKSVETVCAFVIGMVGAVLFMFAETIVWDVTDRLSVDLAWELRLTKYMNAVHIVLAVLVNAIIIGGGLIGVWLAKG